MKRKRVLVIGAACALIGAVVLIACLSGPKEPEYKGIRLSRWVAVEFEVMRPGYVVMLNAGRHSNEQILEAVKAMGPAGMTALVRWVGYEPSPVEKFVSKLILRLPGSVQGWKLCMWLKGDWRQGTAEGAALALKQCGSEVLPYLPELSRIQKNRAKATASWRAFMVLAELESKLKAMDLAAEGGRKGPPWLQKSPHEDAPTNGEPLGDGGVFKSHGIRKRPQAMDSIWYSNASDVPRGVKLK